MASPNLIRALMLRNGGGAGPSFDPSQQPMMGAMPDADSISAMPDIGGGQQMPGLAPPQDPAEQIGQPAPSAVFQPPARQPGMLKKMLMDFAYGASESLKHQFGMETDAEKQERDFKNQMTMREAQRRAALDAVQKENMARDDRRAAQRFAWEQQDRAALRTQQQQTEADKLAEPERKRREAEELRRTEDKIRFERALKAGLKPGTKEFTRAYLGDTDPFDKPVTPKDTTARDANMSRQSYQFHSNALDKMSQPIDQFMQRSDRLKATLNQRNMTADALAPPELMTVMAGGMGSGLRINEAEISRVVGGRTNWETLKADMQRWSLMGDSAVSITDVQRNQMRKLIDEVNRQMQEKSKVINDARNEISQSDDPMEHRRIYAKARSRFSGSVTPDASTPAAGGWEGILQNSKRVR